MLTFMISVAIMLTVVAASAQWAVRTERRRNPREEPDGRHH
jgi:hypothetical protein